MDPIKFSNVPDKETLEVEINRLTETVNIKTLIEETKRNSTTSLVGGIILMVLALIASGGIAYFAKGDEKSCTVQCCQEKGTGNGNRAISCCCDCSNYDTSVYGFIFLAALGLTGGIILLRSYNASQANVKSFQNELLALRDIQLAWQMSKALPEWVEKEPEKITKEWEANNLKKKDSKGKEWTYPQQRAQQQIIETLLSRLSK